MLAESKPNQMITLKEQKILINTRIQYSNQQICKICVRIKKLMAKTKSRLKNKMITL